MRSVIIVAVGIPPAPVSLIEIVDQILDDSATTDTFSQVPLVGVELFTIGYKGIIGSIEGYLKRAERVYKIGLIATLTPSTNTTASVHAEPQEPTLPMPLHPPTANIFNVKNV
jgi:hypothetical protein